MAYDQLLLSDGTSNLLLSDGSSVLLLSTETVATSALPMAIHHYAMAGMLSILFVLLMA